MGQLSRLNRRRWRRCSTLCEPIHVSRSKAHTLGIAHPVLRLPNSGSGQGHRSLASQPGKLRPGSDRIRGASDCLLRCEATGYNSSTCRYDARFADDSVRLQCGVTFNPDPRPITTIWGGVQRTLDIHEYDPGRAGAWTCGGGRGAVGADGVAGIPACSHLAGTELARRPCGPDVDGRSRLGGRGGVGRGGCGREQCH